MRYTQFILRDQDGKISDILECLHGSSACRDLYRFARLQVRNGSRATLQVVGVRRLCNRVVAASKRLQ